MTNLLDSVSIDPDISRAWTLPAMLYTNPAVFAAEKEKIFSATWQVIGRHEQVAKAGDYFTTEVAGEPLLVVRDADGRLRGFYNVCRHRAGPPAEGCGSRKLFRCGYHGWTYGLDGTLISATEIEGVEGFRPEDFSLVPVRTEEWFNLIFVNLSPDARPLRESLGDLPQQAEHFPFVGMKLFERRTYDMKCNWKTYVDNYLEGYHLPSVHPGLNRELDFNAYVVEPYPGHVRQFSPIRGAQPGDTTPRRYSQASADLTTDYFWIFPNWMLNCYPITFRSISSCPSTLSARWRFSNGIYRRKTTNGWRPKSRWHSVTRFSLKMSASAKLCRRICIRAATPGAASA
jgi:choline monooxygenase